jgi:hypothetical protein
VGGNPKRDSLLWCSLFSLGLLISQAQLTQRHSLTRNNALDKFNWANVKCCAAVEKLANDNSTPLLLTLANE